MPQLRGVVPVNEEGLRERLHFALALLSHYEWNWNVRRQHEGHCPQCGYPVHRGHEPGCSLYAVLTGSIPVRLMALEETHGDAAFGVDGNDRRKHATLVADPRNGGDG